MKRIITVLLSVCMIVCMVPTVALAEGEATEIEIQIDEQSKSEAYEFYLNSTLSQYNLQSCVKVAIESEAKRLNIPVSDITKLTVSTSGDGRLRFADCAYIAKEMPGLNTLDITNADFYDDAFAVDWLPAANIDHRIPAFGFADESNITTVYPFSGTDRNVTTKFTRMGNDAFAGTKLSGDIVIPNTVTEIAGFNKTKITGINKQGDVNYIDGNIEIIGQALVWMVPTFTGKVVFGDKVREIASMAFLHSGVSGDIILEGAIESVGVTAFQYCPSIESVRVGSNVSEFLMKASFQGCTNLKSIIIEDGANVSIDDNICAECGKLAYIYFGKDVVYDGSIAGNAGKNVVISTDKAVDGKTTKLNLSEMDGGIIYVGKEDVLNVLDPNWKNNMKNIIADMDGGSIRTDAAYPGKDTLTEPYKDGYTFLGWFVKNADGTLGEKLTGAPSEKTIYCAKWKLANPTVTASVDKDNVVSGSSVTLTAEVPPVEGVTYEYRWYAGGTEDRYKIDGATEKDYTASDLTSDTTYYCKVTAVVGDERSEAGVSAPVKVTVAAEEGNVTITNNKTTATSSEKQFTFTYTASGDVTVESSDTSVATVEKGENNSVEVTIKGEGETVISVKFAGNKNFTAASDSFTLTVKKATPISYPTVPTDPLKNDKTETSAAVANYVKAEDYEVSEQAEIKEIVDEAKKDIEAAKTAEEVKAIEAAAKAEIDKLETAEEKALIKEIEGIKLVARSKQVKMKSGKKAVKITWKTTDGKKVEFDGVEIYRSVKRYSGYGKKPFFSTKKNQYYNTKIKTGTKYYYRVRGFKYVNDEKVYTEYSKKAWRTVK